MSAEPEEPLGYTADYTADFTAQERENLERWEKVLTELEDNLIVFLDGTTVTQQARSVARAWRPPHDLGPMPAVLGTRARLLAMAQQRAYQQLRGESRAARQQAELIRRVPASSSNSAVYLDVAG